MNCRKISLSLIVCLLFLPHTNANAASPKASRTPITINFINQAADVDGVWNDAIRSDFVEAMNVAANDVSTYWRNGRRVLVGSDLKSGIRLIVVDGPLYFGKAQVGGYHWHDRTGSYAIFDLNMAVQQDGTNGPFLFGSHELDEMLADPGANRFIHQEFAEIVDPVVCCHYDLALSDGNVVAVNDFVLPTWFTPRATGPFDFSDSPFIQAPFQDGPGGF
jgi:hypothetical protein